MIELKLIKTLEYYDVPQIIVAADTTGAQYLCILYKNDSERGYLYLGVHMSEDRMAAFIDGQLDLRDAYTHPESVDALYLVTVKQGVLNLASHIQPQDITEEMLPEAEYKYSIS